MKEIKPRAVAAKSTAPSSEPQVASSNETPPADKPARRSAPAALDLGVASGASKPAAPRGRRRWPLWLALAALIVGLAAATWYWYSQASLYRQNPNRAAEQQTDVLLKKVGALIELPTGEKPDVSTVVDANKLKDAPYYKGVQKGDQLIVYNKANKAILYRPATNQVINVGAAYDNVAGIRIAIMAASGNTAKAKAQEVNDTIIKQFNNVQVASPFLALSGGTKGVTVVDVSGNNGPAAKQLAQIIGGSVGSLPSGTSAPANIDLVVTVVQ